MNETERFREHLSTLIRAPYTYIGLISYEEDRASAMVREIAQTLGRPFRYWNPGVGFTPSLQKSDKTHTSSGLSQALRQIMAHVEPGLYLLPDVHPWLEQASIVRELRELEPGFSALGKTLIFLSPCFEVPPELERDITTLTLPLPGRDELKKLFRVVFPVSKWPHLAEERVLAGALGLTQRQALRAFHRARIEVNSVQQSEHSQHLEHSIIGEKRRLIRSDILEYYDLVEGIDEVGGLWELKQWLDTRKDAFGQRAKAFGLPAPRGLLLLGVQGCGKSLMAKVVAHYWGLPLLRLDIGTLFGAREGPDRALSRAIKTSEALSPVVLWMDELEKGFDPGIGGETTRLLGTLVTWLQEKTCPVFFVATANQVKHLPPELLRKGRFDEIFFVDLPDVHERLEILKIHIRKRGRDPRTFQNLENLPAKLQHFTGSELEQIVIDGMYRAFAGNQELDTFHLLEAYEEMIPLYRTYEDQIKELREWAMERTRKASRDVHLLDFFRT